MVELEVDVNAPEPPSKKALRKAKKSFRKPGVKPEGAGDELVGKDKIVTTEVRNVKKAERSDHSIWIGNLPWNAARSDLRTFLTDKASIEDSSITRLHMPSPTQATTAASQQRLNKPQNKGFAYVDLASRKDLEAAISLSETLLSGRRVLIKDAKSFEGRPEPRKEAEKAPSKRIFVGNLSFDITEDDLREHFGRCGEVVSVFAATFEDSGKCKGYAWVAFEDITSASNAVRGWVELKEEGREDGDSEHDQKEDQKGAQKEAQIKKRKKKPRKWWVNRMKGRDLRMEFAEDQATRYKKRFCKHKESSKDDFDGQDAARGSSTVAEAAAEAPAQEHAGRSQSPAKDAFDRHSKPKPDFNRKADSRKIKTGAALAGAPRLTGAIVASSGKKTTFD